MKNQYLFNCNIAQTLNRIGDKWCLLIIHEIMIGHKTYKELKDNLIGIPTNLLSNRLKELEEYKLIKAELYQKHPPRYEYQLTEAGEDLRQVLVVMVHWGEKHLKEDCYKELRHVNCGGPIEITYHCEKCEKEVKIEEIQAKDIKNEKKTI